ncbi:MAG: hypothetical protein ABI861_02815 [Panacibacter sp.]
MSEVSFFYKGRMSWLNELQLFRKDLQRMKLEVDILCNNADKNNSDRVQINQFSESIETIDKELDCTEKSILFSLNNGKNYWVDACGNNFNPRDTISIENDLFDRMKNNYINLIELLKSINNYCSKTDFAI